jgi:hypothetical protein
VTIGRLEIPEGFVTRGNRGIKVSRGKLTFISDSRPQLSDVWSPIEKSSQ